MCGPASGDRDGDGYSFPLNPRKPRKWYHNPIKVLYALGGLTVALPIVMAIIGIDPIPFIGAFIATFLFTSILQRRW